MHYPHFFLPLLLEAHLVRLSVATMLLIPEAKGEHIRSITMKNLCVWIVLIVTATLGVAVAQPTAESSMAHHASAIQRLA